MDRIVVVSNRVPSLQASEASAGGLAVGLKAALETTGGIWFGWNGCVSAEGSDTVRIEQERPYVLATLGLTQEEYDGYYAGFANRALWPLLHSRLDLVHFSPSDFAQYLAVNEKFARNMLPRIGAGDQIWVHDYHLIPLAEMLRRKGVDGSIGFFLHVPFPAADVLAALPCHQELVRALTAYDLIGLQTDNDVRNFREFVLRHLGGEQLADGSLCVLGRRFRVEAFPIGIDPQQFGRLAAAQEESKAASDRLMIIGVDRLDYTKGLTYRLRAFERMLARAPRYRGMAELLQIAAPSREAVPEYRALRDELDALSGRINARYADIDWTPIRYLNRAYGQAQLAGLYRRSRVGLVTPLRDGMNLVAKEYVAAQNPLDPGVLVLSRFAGAAERLDGALIVNPYDIDTVAEALVRAFEMPLAERRARWSRMMEELREHDIHDWRRRFLRSLGNVKRPAATVERPTLVTPTWPGSLAASVAAVGSH
jgi:trehalose 6-phosphate synthase